MASFNTYIPATNDPTYLGYSKEIEGPKPNLAFGKLFHGIGETVSSGLKGATDLLDIKIDDEARKLVAAQNAKDVGSLSLQDAAELGRMKNKVDKGGLLTPDGPGAALGSSPMSYTEGSATLLPGGTQNAPETPVEVQRGISQLDRMFDRYQSGQGSQTYWLMEQQVMAQQLKQRYPGSEKEVDAALHRGTAPANAIRAQVYGDFQAAVAAANTNADKWVTEAKGYEKELGVEGMQRAQQAQGNPQQQWAIRQEVAGIRKREHDRSVAAADLEYKTAQRKSNVNDFEEAGTKIATSIVAGAASGTLFGASNMGLQSIQDSISKLNSESLKDPGVKQGLSAKLQEVTTFTQNQIYNEMYANTRDDPDNPGKKTSIASKIGAKRANEIMNEVMDPILQARKFLDGDNPTLAANHLQLVKIAEQNQALKAISVPYFQLYSGVSQVAGPQVAGQLMDLENKNTSGKSLSDGLEALKKVQETTTVFGGTGSLKKSEEEMRQVDPNASGAAKTEFLQNRINFYQKIFRDSKTPIESKINAAKELSNEDNRAFVRAFKIGEQMDVWSQVSAPDISSKIKELSNTDPKIWDKYKNWNTETFKILFQEHVDHLQKKISSGAVIDVQFNDKTGQLEFATPPTKYGLGGRPVSSFPIGREDIDKLNAGLRTLNGILAPDGEQTKIPQILKDMSFSVPSGTGPRSSLGQQILAAVENPISKQSKSSEDSSQVQTTPKRMSFAPEEASSIIKANMDPDKPLSHLEGMSSSLKQGLASLLQSAPPEVKSGLEIFSGYRSKERQAELYAAAVKKYGSPEAASKWVAPPGHSMHNTGNAADLKFASPDVRDWLHQNAPKFGLHFPLSNEPWHIEPISARNSK